jgi:hypothetical protein
MLTQTEIEFQADQAREYLCRNPQATLEDWAESKDIVLKDRVSILLELQNYNQKGE